MIRGVFRERSFQIVTIRLVRINGIKRYIEVNSIIFICKRDFVGLLNFAIEVMVKKIKKSELKMRNGTWWSLSFGFFSDRVSMSKARD